MVNQFENAIMRVEERSFKKFGIWRGVFVMEFDELTPQEQEIFMEVAQSKIEDEVFMADGKNYFSLVTKGLVKEIPNANFLAASVILTTEGKKLRDKVLKKENN